MVRPTEHLEIIRGDDRTSAAGQAIEWTDPGTWPALAGATFALTVRDKATDTIQLTKAGAHVVGPPQKIRFEPTHAETALMSPGFKRHWFDVQATIAGQVRTLILGECTVWPDQSR